MDVDEGNIKVMDGCKNDIIVENCPITIPTMNGKKTHTVHPYKYLVPGSIYGVPVQIKETLPCLKKNLNAPRPSEHPPVRGKNVKTFRWDQ